ncbi:MAG TPA: NADH-quinone oxidoreductase subunit J [Solirubrobacteraceae bacterium]|nr:NADH-quinone oxidoreductase subunit J [Solirubrobacteraceae bacterium]
MSTVLFFIAAIGAIAGAIGVVTVANPFYSVLALVGHLISLAALFLLLRAEFVAAAQVVVYAGAVMVLYTFVVSYVGGAETPGRGGDPLGQPAGGATMTLAAWACGGALVIELFIAVLGSGLKGVRGHGAPYVAGFGSPQSIGDLLLTRFLAPFEIASYLLLIAAVGAVVLARRRGGIQDGDDGVPVVTAMDIFRPRPQGTGTMAEGVGGRVHTNAAPEPVAVARSEPEPVHAGERADA